MFAPRTFFAKMQNRENAQRSINLLKRKLYIFDNENDDISEHSLRECSLLHKKRIFRHLEYPFLSYIMRCVCWYQSTTIPAVPILSNTIVISFVDSVSGIIVYVFSYT